MEQQPNPVWEVVPHRAVSAPPPEEKADNRAYAIASLACWAEVARSEPAPVFDAQAVPEQPVPAGRAADYPNSPA